MLNLHHFTGNCLRVVKYCESLVLLNVQRQRISSVSTNLASESHDSTCSSASLENVRYSSVTQISADCKAADQVSI